MAGQRAFSPPAWREGQKILMRREKRLWILLTTEEVFKEDGTSPRRTGRRCVGRLGASSVAEGATEDLGVADTTAPNETQRS